MFCSLGRTCKKKRKEKQNNISISVLSYEDKTPYHIYTSTQKFEMHDLLLLLNFKNSHYISIKDVNRFMTNKIKNHGKKKETC